MCLDCILSIFLSALIRIIVVSMGIFFWRNIKLVLVSFVLILNILLKLGQYSVYMEFGSNVKANG